MGNVDKIMENEPPVSMNHSYHGFGRQLKVLDANNLRLLSIVQFAGQPLSFVDSVVMILWRPF